LRSLHSFLGAKASTSRALHWASCRSVSNACATACPKRAQYRCSALIYCSCIVHSISGLLAESLCDVCCHCVTGVRPNRHWLMSSSGLVCSFVDPNSCNLQQPSISCNGLDQTSLKSKHCYVFHHAAPTQHLCSSCLPMPCCRPAAKKKYLQL